MPYWIFHFVFITFRFGKISFRFVWFRFDRFRFVSFDFVSFRSVSFRFYFVSNFTGTRKKHIDLITEESFLVTACSYCMGSTIVQLYRWRNRKHPFWHLWTSCLFSVVDLWSQNNPINFKVNLMSIPNRDWFQLAQWFQRR